MKKSFPLLVVENKAPMRNKKAESRIKDDRKNAHEMHKKHNEPDGEHNANTHSVKRHCICSNVLQSFQDLGDVVTSIKTHGSVKMIVNPAGGNIVARGKSECPKRSGMVSTFISQISTVTVHVLHGEPKPVLGVFSLWLGFVLVACLLNRSL